MSYLRSLPLLVVREYGLQGIYRLVMFEERVLEWGRGGVLEYGSWLYPLD